MLVGPLASGSQAVGGTAVDLRRAGKVAALSRTSTTLGRSEARLSRRATKYVGAEVPLVDICVHMRGNS